MGLRASHVLAQGAGTSDVVGDMWKLSRVYPAQPSLGLLRGQSRHYSSQTCIQTNKHRHALCVYMNVCVCAFLFAFRFGCVGVFVCHHTLVLMNTNQKCRQGKC